MKWLIERLIALVPVISELSRDQRAVADNALIAMSHALNEAHICVKQIRDGRLKSRQTEEQLARYWADAAVPLRHRDRELAEMCTYKSEVWLDPDGWDPEKIRPYGLDLESVREKYRELLSRK